MQKFETFFQESMIDIPRGNLDPKVFMMPDDGGKPYLAPSIKKQIFVGLDSIADLLPIKNCYIVGSILTKYWSERSDIDVNVEVFKEDVDDLTQANLLNILKTLNGQLATGSTHPINYYIHLETPDPEKYDAIYDIKADKWLKDPIDLEVNLSDYYQNFNKVVSKIDLTLAQLRRDIIDYDALMKFNPEDIKNLQTILNRKLFEITDKIETLSDIRHTIVKKKKKAFKKPLTPEEIQLYKSKNTLPEVILDKLIQRYYYWDFIKKLEKILADKDQLDTEDVEKIKKIDQDACLKTFESYVESPNTILIEKIKNIKKIKLSKIDYDSKKGQRSKSFLQRVNRGMNRKSLIQVPNVHRPTLTASNIGSAKKIVDVAKRAPSGVWRLTPSQVKWIAVKYHFIPPDAHKSIKHLGNTGIMVWRKAKNAYYLVKQGAAFGSPK
jgi:hypothetical protein